MPGKIDIAAGSLGVLGVGISFKTGAHVKLYACSTDESLGRGNNGQVRITRPKRGSDFGEVTQNEVLGTRIPPGDNRFRQSEDVAAVFGKAPAPGITQCRGIFTEHVENTEGAYDVFGHIRQYHVIGIAIAPDVIGVGDVHSLIVVREWLIGRQHEALPVVLHGRGDMPAPVRQLRTARNGEPVVFAGGILESAVVVAVEDNAFQFVVEDDVHHTGYRIRSVNRGCAAGDDLHRPDQDGRDGRQVDCLGAGSPGNMPLAIHQNQSPGRAQTAQIGPAQSCTAG